MSYIKAFFTNYVLMSAIIAWLLAQIIKVITGAFDQRKFSIVELLFGSGGMPSSHTAAVIAVLISSFVAFGPGSYQIAFAGVFSMIVIRDATGVRREMGEQAKIINQMVPEEQKKDWKRELKERVGHTPKQVFFGAIVGIAVPLLLLLIPVFRPAMEWL